MSGVKTGLPYRAPCGGWERPKYLGSLVGCHQHKNAAHASIPVYENTTQVPSYFIPADPELIDPYQKLNCFQFEQPDDTNYSLICGGWPEPVPANTYAPKEPPETIDLSVCRKIGFKNVFAAKSWHGRYAFDNCDLPCSHDCRGGCTWEEVLGCCHEEEHLTPPTTKYLTQRWTLLHRNTNMYHTDDPLINLSTYEVTVSVDRYSGKKTIVGVENTITIDGVETGHGAAGADLYNFDHVCGHWALRDPENSGGTYLALLEVLNTGVPNGSMFLNAVSTSPTLIMFKAQRGTLDREDNLGLDEWEFETELTDPYTNEDLNADVNALLATWDMTRDDQYPWRTDNFCTRGPFVTRFEKPIQSPDFIYPATLEDGTPWVDTSDETGEILGAPNPPGYEPFFNFRQIVWDKFPDMLGVLHWDWKYFGEEAPAWVRFATQWVDNFIGLSFLPGAFAAYNSLTFEGNTVYSGYLLKAKYAETIIKRHSQNYARPFGRDRYTMETATVRCIYGVADGVVTLTNNNLSPATGPTSIESGDVCLVIGDESGNDGVYQVTKLGDNLYQLVTQVATLPETMTSVNAFFGKLRWPDARAIGGRVEVTDASNETPIKITVRGSTYLRDGDLVVIDGVEGNTAANTTLGPVAVTRVGPANLL